MKDILKPFEHLPAIVEKIDNLVDQATRIKGKKDKRILLTEAQRLADAYQEHCEDGGNDKKQFNAIL
jgi:hypothetical protein